VYWNDGGVWVPRAVNPARPENWNYQTAELVCISTGFAVIISPSNMSIILMGNW